LASGDIKPDDLVWHRGLTEWMPAESLPGLFSPPPVPGNSLEDVASAEREVVSQVSDKVSNEEDSTLESLPANEPTQTIWSNPPKKSYFVRHWRGELSLGVSYWINGQLLTALYYGLIIAIIELLDPTTKPTFYAIVIVAFWVTVYIITLWQIVGLWRASTNHIRKTKRVFWARVVQIIVILCVIQSVRLLFVTAWPQVNEYVKLALHIDDYGKYKIRVLRQGTELEFSGAIAFGLTEEIKKHLDANPNIRVIHLNSVGGRIVEARKLRDLIASRQLITYSSQGCFSACADAFMGGKVRVLHKDAKLGFHQPSFPGLNQDQLNSEIESEKQFLLSAGIDRRFVEKALSTPQDDMWKPSAYELLQAHVITQVSDGSDFAMSISDSEADLKKVESSLLEIPIYQTLKTYCPETYEQILTEMQNSFKKGDSKSELMAKVRTRIYSVLQKSLPLATDDAIVEFVQVMINELQQLGSKSGDLCYAYLFPQRSGGLDYAGHLSEELRGAELNANAKVIRTASTTPQPIPSKRQVSKYLEDVTSSLIRQYGSDAAVLADIESPQADKAKVCELSIAFYREILKLPKNDSAALLRWLFAGGVPEQDIDILKNAPQAPKPIVEESRPKATSLDLRNQDQKETIENTLRSYYQCVARNDIDGAIKYYTATKRSSIKRNVLESIAKDTEYFQIEKMDLIAKEDSSSKVVISLEHKKYGDSPELWEITAELVEEGGEWKIAETKGRRIK